MMDISVCVLEKASEIGAHFIEAVIETLLLIDFFLLERHGSPIKTKVKKISSLFW